MPRLQLKSIKCEKRQDSISKDEPYILLDSSKAWSGSGFKNGTLRTLENVDPHPFDDQVRIQLFENDRNSRDDLLGEKIIYAFPLGARTARFNDKPGADYEIFYEVIED